MKKLHFFLILFISIDLFGQGKWEEKFEQLGTTLPTPNNYRTASGAPGKDYWQQKADYHIRISLNDENQSITGSEQITYYNNSPDNLSYLWLQLDQNVRSKDSETPLVTPTKMDYAINSKKLQSLTNNYSNIKGDSFEGGFKISSVTDNTNNPLKYNIIKTMMRIDLKSELKSGTSFIFNIDWSYNINDRMNVGGRSGYEYFEEEVDMLPATSRNQA